MQVGDVFYKLLDKQLHRFGLLNIQINVGQALKICLCQSSFLIIISFKLYVKFTN